MKRRRMGASRHEHDIIETSDRNILIPVDKIFYCCNSDTRFTPNSLSLMVSPDVPNIIIELPVPFVAGFRSMILNPVPSRDHRALITKRKDQDTVLPESSPIMVLLLFLHY
jgi:hypothetical protein